jgi:succinate dehydrogenase / fumarate reductase flavoprotein subunit
VLRRHARPNRLGGNSLSDLLVFGRRAGLGAADYVRALSSRPTVSQESVDAAANWRSRRSRPEGPGERLHPARRTAADDERPGRHHPHLAEIQEALDKIEEYKARYRNIEADGKRPFNPGWHLAIDMRNMLLVSECVAGRAPKAAAGTPATTIRRWTPSGGARCWLAGRG